jgi:hypothetical protein
MKIIFKLYGWVFVRPRRYLFGKMAWASCLRLLPKKNWDGWRFPNLHWWVLNKTVFRFFEWLAWGNSWRYFCAWENGGLKHKPFIARVIHRIGRTTAGYAMSGGECFHCANEEGDPVDLSMDETGEFFKLEKTWFTATEDGTDYRFCGTTVCPKCGYKQSYEDGSL